MNADRAQPTASLMSLITIHSKRALRKPIQVYLLLLFEIVPKKLFSPDYDRRHSISRPEVLSLSHSND